MLSSLQPSNVQQFFGGHYWDTFKRRNLLLLFFFFYSDSVFICDKDRVLENCTAADIDNSGSRLDELWAMLLGQALMGVAYGPLFPLALTYLDDQVKGTTTPVYIGKTKTKQATCYWPRKLQNCS